MTVRQLLDILVELSPEVRDLRDAHVREQGDLLPHVLFGDLTRWLVAHHPQRAILDLLETSFITGDSATRDLIAASFVENIEPAPEFLPLRDSLGPRLRELWDSQYG